MSALPVDLIRSLSDQHPKPPSVHFQYGTAGFRTLGSMLDPVMFRVGILAGLRSKKLDGKTIGVMVTASHNPEPDNGVKLVDPRGEMLEASWEVHATNLANAPTTQAFIEALDTFVQTLKIDLSKPARVVYARDTRPSGGALVAALEDGFKAIGVEARNAGVTTTPVLHYLLSTAFKKLVAGKTVSPPLVVDCANGVGAIVAEKLMDYLGNTLQIIPHNTAISQLGVLNHSCGADFVKTSQKLPPSLSSVLKAGQRACSLDGDADRLMYYYLDDRAQFHMLDGDKIAALVAAFIVELTKAAGLEGRSRSASYKRRMQTRLPVKCVPTGVKHLHHAAEHYDIGVYFEANGHGTVLFSRDTQQKLASHQPSTPAQSTALNHIINLTQLINQTVGDALSDMLLVEVVLTHKSYNGLEWDSLYVDLPNRLVKVVVADRNIFKTEDAESAELAFRVAGLVYDEAGGDPGKRPVEFL
ncbi:Phosphoacetylglucosamine mutase [Grifola frondosa]|uniref:phosphoacetylglucosamine mutase n=1 Tax=Grifola frondosa TaxID=5627 RepID=A0A1C7MSM1_GRIFR|nr:Phosphoacetylglucosamine mutase [Grifola frondosa]